MNARNAVLVGVLLILSQLGGCDDGEKPAADSGPDTDTNSAECTWNLETGDGALYDVWGFAADDVYAVGNYEYYSGPYHDFPAGIVKHWDGNSLVEFYVHDVDGGSRFTAIWGSSPSNFYVTGLAYPEGDVVGILLHRDGGNWEIVDETAATWVNSLWGADDSGVYGVGSSAEGTAIVRFWDGTSWSLALEVPELHEFRDIWGRSGEDVYALGTTNPQQDGGSSHVFHFDGESWSEIPSNLPVRLVALYGDGADGLYAVGGYSDPETIHHFDGTEWSLAFSAMNSMSFSDVLTLAPDRVLVVGGAAPGGRILQGDGESWEIDPNDAPSSEYNFHAIWASSPQDCVIVGGGGLYYGVFVTMACGAQ